MSDKENVAEFEKDQNRVHIEINFRKVLLVWFLGKIITNAANRSISNAYVKGFNDGVNDAIKVIKETMCN